MTVAQQQQLIEAALAVRQQAHAPYSKFLVGAALLDDQGAIHIGCNVENASYSLTICAERVAIGAAVAAGRRRFVAIAIAADPAVSPCGACRQVLAEFAPSLSVLLVDANTSSLVKKTTMAELLPLRFEFQS